MEKPVAGSLRLQCLNFHGKCFSLKVRIQISFQSGWKYEKQTDKHTLMLDMLHSNMSVVCTYHCRGVFHEKYFLV